MNISELKAKLEDAYSVRNLNNISLTLINLYKEKAFSKLQKIAEIIEDFEIIEISSEGKGFSGLIKLYHPDRADYYCKEILRLFNENNFDGMLELSHVLRLERIDEIAESLNSFEEIDYSPVYEWDWKEEGLTVKEKDTEAEEYEQEPVEYNFYDAVKIRQYGNTDIEFPPYYLEDFEEFEMSGSSISDLDGVQYCKHAKIIDLSDNLLTDISLLSSLVNLEEVNLSGNLLDDISDLTHLTNLKRIYLSFNNIKDISVLSDLPKLEYAELTGNPITDDQIINIKDSGIIVEF